MQEEQQLVWLWLGMRWSALVYRIFRDTWGLAVYSCHASSYLWKIAREIWLKLGSCIYFAVARDRFGGLELFNILFSFLQVNSKWLLTDFKREWGSKSSQKASICPMNLCKILLKEHIQSFHPGDWLALSQRIFVVDLPGHSLWNFCWRNVR